MKKSSSMTLYTVNYINGEPTYFFESVEDKKSSPSQKYTCNKCGLQFVSEIRLQSHQSTHDPLKKQKKESQIIVEPKQKVEDTKLTFICPSCDYSTQVRSEIISHFNGSHCFKASEMKFESDSEEVEVQEVEVETEQDIEDYIERIEYSCEKCGFASFDQDDIDFHTCKDKNDSTFSCHLCTYECYTSMGLQSHITRKHKSQSGIGKPHRYACEECDYKCSNKNTLYSHKRRHKQANSSVELDVKKKPKKEVRKFEEECTYFCNECEFSSQKKGSLYLHIQRAHGKEMDNFRQAPERQNVYVCDHCDYTNKSRYEMKVHVIRKHTNEYKYECEICGKKYKIRGDLTNHVRFQHREQPIICDVCGKTCGNSNSLYVHQKFAHYKAEFECPICHRRMVSQANLDEHVLKQHEQREDAICEECGKTFSRQSRLKIHMRIHLGLKPHTCKICGKAFGRKTALRQHLLIHTGQRPYVCDICGKAFTQKPGLISHRKSHPGSHPPLPRITIDHVISDLLTENTITSSRQRRFVFQKKLVKIKPSTLQAVNSKGKVVRIAAKQPVVQVKVEPGISLSTNDFEEVHIDGTPEEKKPQSPVKKFRAILPKPKDGNLVVYMCKTCNVYFPTRPGLDTHNSKVHPVTRIVKPKVLPPAAISTKTAPKVSPKTELSSKLKPKYLPSKTDVLEGFSKTMSGDYKCQFCSFISPAKQTISLHVTSKHSVLLKISADAEETELKEEIEDDEESWPMETIDDDLLATVKEEEKSEDESSSLKTCPFCPFESSDISTLHSHIKRKHRQSWLKSVAQKVTAMRSKNNDSLRSCSFCNFKAVRLDIIEKHVAENHPEEAETQKKLRQCPYCPFTTTINSTFNSHITRNHSVTSERSRTRTRAASSRPPNALQHTGYACNFCSFVAASVPSMKNHTVREHTDKRQPFSEVPVPEFDCDQCEFKTKYRRDMQHHQKRDHTSQANDDGMFSCNSCSYETLSRMGLQRHVSIKHYKPRREAAQPNAIFVCEQCDFNSYNMWIVEWHRKQHEEDSAEDGITYFCDDCSFSTWLKSLLFSHIMRRHRDLEGNDRDQRDPLRNDKEGIKCDLCDYTTKNKHVLKVHVIRKHTEDYSHECEICGKKYKVKADLTNHIRFQHREQPIICDVCGKTCRNSNLLYLHQKFAHYKPDFECHICHRRMVSQANLDDHILKQHEQRQDAICEECGKRFSKAARLKIHMRVHTGVKPYTCKVCFKAFARRNGLRQHLLIHTGQRPYVCDICGKAFTQKTGLISHRKSHPGSHPPLPRVTIDHVLNDLLHDPELTMKKRLRVLDDEGNIYDLKVPESQIVFSTSGFNNDDIDDDGFEEVSIDGTSSNAFEKTPPSKDQNSLSLGTQVMNGLIFFCKACNIYFSLKSIFDAHMLSTHTDKKITIREEFIKLGENEYACTKCSYICFERSVMVDHIHINHPKKVAERKKNKALTCILERTKKKLGAGKLKKSNVCVKNTKEKIEEIIITNSKDGQELRKKFVVKNCGYKEDQSEVEVLHRRKKYPTILQKSKKFERGANLMITEEEMLEQRDQFAEEVAIIDSVERMFENTKNKYQNVRKNVDSMSSDREIYLSDNTFDDEVVITDSEELFVHKTRNVPNILHKNNEFERNVNLTDSEKKMLRYSDMSDEEITRSHTGEQSFQQNIPRISEKLTKFNKRMFINDDEPKKDHLSRDFEPKGITTEEPPVEDENEIIITDVSGRKRIIKLRKIFDFKSESDIKDNIIKCNQRKSFSTVEELSSTDTEDYLKSKISRNSFLKENTIDLSDTEEKSFGNNNQQRVPTNFAGNSPVNLVTESEDTIFRVDQLIEGDLEMADHIMSSSSNSNLFQYEKPAAFTCEYCSYESDSRRKMHSHLRTEHKEEYEHVLKLQEDQNTFNCMYCKFVTFSRTALNGHTRILHPGCVQPLKSRKLPPKIYNCDHCSFTTDVRRRYQIHIERNHIFEAKFACEYCGKKFKVKSDLSNHIKFQHTERPMVCEICGKVCNNTNTLHLHQKREHFKPEFECEICHRRMVTQANLDEHIKKQHLEKSNFMCEQCGKVFDLWSKLKNHSRVHTGEKPHKCHLCDRSFARRAVYRQHLLLHTGQRPYICDICGKSFAQKPGLICHRKSHPGEKPPLPVVFIDHILNKYVKKENQEDEDNIEESADDFS